MIVDMKGIRREFRLGSVAVEALRGVDLEISSGEFCAIVGPSGSGKTSLLHILGGMDRPSSGSYAFDGIRVDGLDGSALTAFRARSVGFVFQSFHLNPILTAEENVAFALRFGGAGRKAALDAARGWLERLGLSERRKAFPNTLSGGERQRVAIARAVAKHPRLILADEPTGNLDSANASAIVDLLRTVAEAGECSIVMVTHNEELAAKTDRIIRLKDGRVERPSKEAA